MKTISRGKSFSKKSARTPFSKTKRFHAIGGNFGNSRLPPRAERVLKKMIARFWLPQNRSIFLIPTMFRLVVSLYHLLELFLSENESFRHCLAEPRQPRKKKHSLHFLFGGGEISFEKGKGVFLSGFCLPSIQAGGGTMRTKFCQNYFLGKGFGKTLGYSFVNLDVANVKGGVWGGIFHLLLFLFGGNSGRTCMHYTALLQKNASFPIIYPCHQVKNLGKT